MEDFNNLLPSGLTGFGRGHYAYIADPLEDTDSDDNAVHILNALGYLGPYFWGPEEGGIAASGCLDAQL